MVEYSINYTNIFHALADDTRRDILQQLTSRQQTISELATRYTMSFAAVAKHVAVLESAALIYKTKQGRTQIIAANPATVKSAADYLRQYEIMWDQRFDRLENVIKEQL